MVDARTAPDQVRLADQRWNAALEATEFAPPDPGFGARVRDIADASEQEAAAPRLADSSGVGWNPVCPAHDECASRTSCALEEPPRAPRSCGSGSTTRL